MKNNILITDNEKKTYTLNCKNLNTCDGIENLTETETKFLVKVLNGSFQEIKGFNCYFLQLNGYFGYSCLVFKNNHSIKYVNDYELHHTKYLKDENGNYIEDENGMYKKGKYTEPELKELYINRLNNVLFTETELLEPVKNYDDFRKKEYFLRNYYNMQFNYLSAFVIQGTQDEKIFNRKKPHYKYYNPVSFCYMNNLPAIEKQKELLNHLEKEYELLKTDNEKFREMIRFELFNHEAGISCDYTETLYGIGLSYNSLTDTQKAILNNELNYVIENTF